MSQYEQSSLAEIFESYLSAHQPYGSPDSLYEPIRYINELGGKRIRPVLVLMAYNLWHEDVTPALPAAMAIEYFHNFSLMHDDIMDEAPLRRGKETVHHRFSRNAAILSGDAMMIRCFDLLLEAGRRNDTGADLCSLMSKVALEICEGQQMDMDLELLPSPTEVEYLEMIRKKTACLLGVSLRIGAELAGAQKDEALALYHFGEQMGMGFQIQDDYLDVFGDVHRTGKLRGGDILRGKKNFLYVHSYNLLPPNEQKSFAAAYSMAAEDGQIQTILEWYELLQIAAYVERIQNEYFEKGKLELNQLDEMKTNNLRSFAGALMRRDH